jgi:hypothetical protein
MMLVFPSNLQRPRRLRCALQLTRAQISSEDRDVDGLRVVVHGRRQRSWWWSRKKVLRISEVDGLGRCGLDKFNFNKFSPRTTVGRVLRD